MVNGDPVSDKLQLNIESLWSGGPFANAVSSGLYCRAESCLKEFRRVTTGAITRNPNRDILLPSSQKSETRFSKPLTEERSKVTPQVM
jgi:hypothetical protein